MSDNKEIIKLVHNISKFNTYLQSLSSEAVVSEEIFKTISKVMYKLDNQLLRIKGEYDYAELEKRNKIIRELQIID